ncbi:substrate-binding domain-containing protein [Actinomadura nitritigenes]|uniref:substrate-binding domain-containing protein n=1 Tax=Actinomadura nitritigenes TaxID=134602 RepID=UPI003D8CE0EE
MNCGRGRAEERTTLSGGHPTGPAGDDRCARTKSRARDRSWRGREDDDRWNRVGAAPVCRQAGSGQQPRDSLWGPRSAVPSRKGPCFAIAVLAGMRDQGLTAPTDLAVIGADGILTARFASPPLTTVYFDAREVGRHRAETIVAGLTGDHGRPPLVHSALRLIERSST